MEPVKQINVKLGVSYIDALRRMKSRHHVCIRHLLEQAIATYIYQVHDFRTEEEMLVVVKRINEPPTIKATQWWPWPNPFPETVEALGPRPSPDTDPRGFKAWHRAKDLILARLKAPAVTPPLPATPNAPELVEV